MYCKQNKIMLYTCGTSTWGSDCSSVIEVPSSLALSGTRIIPGGRRSLLLQPGTPPQLQLHGPQFGDTSEESYGAAPCAALPLLLPLSVKGIASVSLGWEHGVLLSTAGALYALGGSGSLVAVGLQGQAARAAACGFQHTVVIAEDGRLFSWGSPKHGALGQAAAQQAEQASPAQPQPAAAANALLAAGEAFVSLAAGKAHTLALSSQGRCAVWGSNRHAQCARLPCSQAEGPAWLPLPVQVQAIAAGWSHCLCLSSTHPQQVFAWGRADMGQLGLGPQPMAAAAAAAAAPGYLATPTPLAGLVCTCSSSSSSSSSEAPALPPHTPLACGAESSYCALACGKCVYSWGWNEHGNLGLGDTATRTQPERVPGLPAAARVRAVLSAGATLVLEME